MSREDIVRQLREKFQQTGQALNELERRRWAANEALALGRGGVAIVSQALRMSPNTVKRGMRELTSGQGKPDSGEGTRIRRSGGGRKSRTGSGED